MKFYDIPRVKEKGQFHHGEVAVRLVVDEEIPFAGEMPWVKVQAGG